MTIDEFYGWYNSGSPDWSTSTNPNPVSGTNNVSTQKGSNWMAVVSFIATTGIGALNAVTTFVQAKKGTNATVKDLDEDTAARLLSLTGGNLSTGSIKSATDIEARNANILGLPLSTWILIIAAVLLYLLFKPSNNNHNKYRKSWH